MTAFQYQQQELYCESTPLSRIAAQVGTPVYVYSKAELLHRAHSYTAAVPPESLICYAVKANGNPAIISLLGQAGFGADVTSGGELFLALHAGIEPSKIIYSGVGKTRTEISTALQNSIRALHVESAQELDNITAVAQELGIVAPVGVRVNPNINAETHPYISTGLHAHKFGVPAQIAMAMLMRAAQHPWLEPVGLAAHIGSQITDLAPFAEAVEYLVGVAVELQSKGIRVSYLDVGGGLGIEYGSDDAPQIGEWAEAVSAPIIDTSFDLVLEPGRSVVGPSGVLLTQVVYTKSQGDKQFLIVDAGMNDLLRPTLYKAQHALLPLRQPVPSDPTAVFDIVGPICETGDFLAKDRAISGVDSGSFLAVMQAGAYGFAMSSNYNGRPRAAEVLVDGDRFSIIRRRQTHQHLLDGCQDPN